MNLVFFDTETTGTNVNFDQLLQFAAVLTDGRLQELDRIDVRCNLLPWVVPSPEALRVTRTQPSRLTDEKLPTHYEMMRQVEAKLREWSPAIFIGYNSFQFDEEFLRRALWQTLQFPWLTVSNGNGRLDLLDLLRMIELGKPDTLKWPIGANGKRSLRLDQLAPANGYVTSAHHDALSDAYATLHLATKVANALPALWETMLSRTDRKIIEAAWSKRSPLLMVDYSTEFGLRFRQCIGPDPNRPGATLFARLDTDWETLTHGSHADIRAAFERPQAPLIPLRASKAPVFLTEGESKKILNAAPSSMTRRQSEFLREHPKAFERILDAWRRIPPRQTASQHLEQQIYAGFPSSTDQKLARRFHDASGSERTLIVKSFKDARLARWAQRLVYVNFPGELSPKERAAIEAAIAERLLGLSEDLPLEWRTLATASQELRAMNREDPFVHEINRFIEKLRSKWEGKRPASAQQ